MILFIMITNFVLGFDEQLLDNSTKLQRQLIIEFEKTEKIFSKIHMKGIYSYKEEFDLEYLKLNQMELLTRSDKHQSLTWFNSNHKSYFLTKNKDSVKYNIGKIANSNKYFSKKIFFEGGRLCKIPYSFTDVPVVDLLRSSDFKINNSTYEKKDKYGILSINFDGSIKEMYNMPELTLKNADVDIITGMIYIVKRASYTYTSKDNKTKIKHVFEADYDMTNTEFKPTKFELFGETSSNKKIAHECILVLEYNHDVLAEQISLSKFGFNEDILFPEPKKTISTNYLMLILNGIFLLIIVYLLNKVWKNKQI